jgi:hypothetical protein
MRMRANIGGPTIFRDEHSASIAACHSGVSCSALRNLVMYSAASRKVISCLPLGNPQRMPYRSANHCSLFFPLVLPSDFGGGGIAVRIGVGRGEYSWAVSLMCTGGEYRGVLHDRHFKAT